jgi:hypothetical protein
MSEKPPRDPVFDNGPGNADTTRESEQERLTKLKGVLSAYLEEQANRPRVDQFYPYLLLRSFPGDRGDRPFPPPFDQTPFWESPDIWTAEGEPSSTPDIPPTPGGHVVAGRPNTVYAHVWNLGRAPISGARVEFYWFNPSLGITGADAHLIGYARADLAPRSSQGCHKLVKCSTAWQPIVENGGHECLVARVSSIGDAVSSSHPWDAWADRHVAQRNISVVTPGMDTSHFVQALEASRPKGMFVQLAQVGIEAKIAVDLVAPYLKLDPAVKTHILAELLPDGGIHLPPTHPDLPRGRVPLHPSVAVGKAEVKLPQIEPAMPFEISRIPAHQVFETRPLAELANVVKAAQPSLKEPGHIRVLASGGNVHLLLLYATLVSPELLGNISHLPAPQKQQAQVLRMSSYQEGRLAGGYTIILSGAD